MEQLIANTILWIKANPFGTMFIGAILLIGIAFLGARLFHWDHLSILMAWVAAWFVGVIVIPDTVANFLESRFAGGIVLTVALFFYFKLIGKEVMEAQHTLIWSWKHRHSHYGSLPRPVYKLPFFLKAYWWQGQIKGFIRYILHVRTEWLKGQELAKLKAQAK